MSQRSVPRSESGVPSDPFGRDPFGRSLTNTSEAPKLAALLPAPSLIHRFVHNWLITDPALLADTSPAQKDVLPRKNYQVQNHEHMNNVFFFGGRFRTIKAPPLNIVTFVLILVPGVLFACFEAQWMWFNLSPALVVVFSYLWLLAVFFFVKAGMSDPGILPRNIHIPLRLDSETKRFVEPKQYDDYFNIISLPHNGTRGKVVVKYCPTCHVWRPPRTSHCDTCNNCVLHHDHHCKFLSNCVGARNYKYFLWFLLATSLASLMLLLLSALQVFHYKYVTPRPPNINNLGDSLLLYPVSFFLAIYCAIAAVYPFLLLGLHLFLTSRNLTTREYLNFVWGNRDPDFKNVFNTRNVLLNLYINWFGKPKGVSLMRTTETYHPGDLRLERVDPLQDFLH